VCLGDGVYTDSCRTPDLPPQPASSTGLPNWIFSQEGDGILNERARGWTPLPKGRGVQFPRYVKSGEHAFVHPVRQFVQRVMSSRAASLYNGLYEQAFGFGPSTITYIVRSARAYACVRVSRCETLNADAHRHEPFLSCPATFRALTLPIWACRRSTALTSSTSSTRTRVTRVPTHTHTRARVGLGDGCGWLWITVDERSVRSSICKSVAVCARLGAQHSWGAPRPQKGGTV
jgi:hypothetical protein